ncbi:MAG: TylF/MycF/NovP-related O-methyltransferase [Bacteroidota bacterium]
MKKDFKKDESLMVEWDRQTKSNLSSMEMYIALSENSQDSTLSKLDNFAKYTRRQALSKFLARTEIFSNILEVHGSILDFGVNAGQSLFTWAQISAIREPLNYTRSIVGFDTFEGFPSLSDKDFNKMNSSEHLKQGGFNYGNIDGLNEAISAYDANRFLSHIPKIELVKGDIKKTLPIYIKENPHMIVSLLHLDMDLYEPTKLALELILPKMPKGAIIVFDELNQKPYPGETLALVDSVGINALKIKRFTWETGLSYAFIE